MSVSPPLLVDLDGSLLRTDSFLECCLTLLKHKPWIILLFPVWLLRGKQTLKMHVCERSPIDADDLPYRSSVISYLSDEHKQGRRIILVTGTWDKIASSVCSKFEFLDSFVATDEKVNLTGKTKAEWAVRTFGEGGFDYLGNSTADLPVWKCARASIVVGDDRILDKARGVSDVAANISVEPVTFKVVAKAIRIHQWAKNLLIFIPLVTAHLALEFDLVFSTFVGFLSLSLCASSTYIVNDLLDLASDRQHPIKRNRPIASGVLPIDKAVILSALLMVVGLALAAVTGIYFSLVLCTYLILTVLYSFLLKQLQTVDVITLASLFTLRVIAGAAVLEIAVSFWLLAFSMFLFLSLAIVKRVSELVRLQSEVSMSGAEKAAGRGYYTSDLNVLFSLGTSAGLVSILVFALYINSEQVMNMYTLPQALWLMCPVLGYWIMRVWMLAARGEMNEDPISFAITDRNSIFAGAAMAAVLVVATSI